MNIDWTIPQIFMHLRFIAAAIEMMLEEDVPKDTEYVQFIGRAIREG